ncbi:MAG: nidogen-like domain-containing protein [Methylococcaceae bacterium]
MNNAKISVKKEITKITQCFKLITSLIFVLAISSVSSQALATNAIRSGFDSNTLAANDDRSSGLVPLGFSINFFGNGFNQGYVNNNGNMTFDSPLGTFTPFGLTATQRQIIAPFFADVDTRVDGSNPVTYGQGTVGSRPAFAVNWINVACFSTVNGGYNTFQMVLIDRSDIGAGDFDIEFNYGSIVWETGRASGGDATCQGGNPVRIGYSNGSSNSFELSGSGVSGTFLDSNTVTGLIYNSRNSLQDGRYLFEVRNGNAPVGHNLSGTVFGNEITNPLESALVQVCTTNQDTFCSLTSTNSLGNYTIGGLSDGNYQITAFPPANTNFQTGSITSVISGADVVAQNITLLGPQPLPSGTTIIPNLRISDGGVPTVNWNSNLTLSTHSCQGGSATYTITDNDTNAVIGLGSLAESSLNSGVYSTIVPALFPNSGLVTVEINITNCLGGGSNDIIFTLYIDPSGEVKDTFGNAVGGATVTLLRSDSSAGPFTTVPNGSNIMSPVNRINPDLTSSRGLFGWDVISGFYKVRAEKTGCNAPNNPSQSFVESDVLTIPPAVTDLSLILDCGQPVFAVCDLDQNGSVSKSDISILSRNLRSTVPAGTLGDINGDGRITTQDTRGCVLQCTLPACAN